MGKFFVYQLHYYYHRRLYHSLVRSVILLGMVQQVYKTEQVFCSVLNQIFTFTFLQLFVVVQQSKLKPLIDFISLRTNFAEILKRSNGLFNTPGTF